MAKRTNRKSYADRDKGNVFHSFIAKTQKQKSYFNLIKHNQIIIAHGSAGTGKSHVALAAAAEALFYDEVSKIVITKPLVEAQEHLGFLPGTIDEKQLPYILPVKAILRNIFGEGFTNSLMRDKKIEVVPLAYMRGITINDAYVVADEMQNSTPGQMKMLLTRIGEGSKLLINGDSRQVDIKGPNGLEDALKRTKWIPGIASIEFDRNDCVRAGIISDIISAYED